MGMLSMNFRILPGGYHIETVNDCWKVCGSSSVKEVELLNVLVSSGIDIMQNVNYASESSNTYLLNQGIEMLIWSENNNVSHLEFRICLSWYEEAIKELYDILMIIKTKFEILDWVTNDEGMDIDSYEAFREVHVHFNKEKIDIYKKSDYIQNMRLTEAELVQYEKKKNSLLGFRRNLKNYRKITGFK